MDLENRMFFTLSGKTWKKRITEHEKERADAIETGRAKVRELTGCPKAEMSNPGLVWFPEKDAPKKGWKQVSLGSGGVFCRPKLNSKQGKEIEKALKELKQPPNVHDFLKKHLNKWDADGFAGNYFLRPSLGTLDGKYVLVLFDSPKNRKLTPPDGMKQIPASKFLQLHEKRAFQGQVAMDKFDFRPEFIISGRVVGDDEDGTGVFRAETEEEAVQRFKDYFEECLGKDHLEGRCEQYGEEYPGIFITETTESYEKPLLEALKLFHSHYGKLHDGLSDMIEGGRLKEIDIPDDYQWLVEMLANQASDNIVSELLKKME